MKKLALLLVFFWKSAYCQEIKKSYDSTMPKNSAYFIKGKLVRIDELIKIKREDIKSVSIVKRDTIVDNHKYSAQFFVVIKEE